MSPRAEPRLSETQALWTCPFCPLLCDRFGVAPAPDGSLGLTGSDCALARSGLAEAAPATAVASAVGPRINGQPATWAQALAAAAQALAAAGQPLLGGLGTDVAGGRALYHLATRLGAISDAAAGAALMHSVRVLQDRGGFTTTLAEVRERADLIVAVGSWPSDRAPELWPRLLAGRADSPPALVALGCDAPVEVALSPSGHCPVDSLVGPLDLFECLPELAALLAGRDVPVSHPGLPALAERLLKARYAVLMWEPAHLGSEAALLIERLQQIIGLLNARTRAAGFPIGGGDGAATVNQVFTWLDGLPLRSRRGPLGGEHEPLRFDAQRLLADGAVDALLWVSSFRVAPVPTLAGPRVVLGLPALASQLGDESRTIFLPVSTPGIHSAGHLNRADGVVMMPLHAVAASPWPSVADAARQLLAALGPAAVGSGTPGQVTAPQEAA